MQQDLSAVWLQLLVQLPRDICSGSKAYSFPYLTLLKHRVQSWQILKNGIFWDVTPRTATNINRCFGVTYRLHFQDRISIPRYQEACLLSAFMLLFCLSYSALKMEEICSSECSADFQRTIRRYISEDRTCVGKCQIQKSTTF
jgi:hypothetical protein